MSEEGMYAEDPEFLNSIKRWGVMDRRRKRMKVKRNHFIKDGRIDWTLDRLDNLGFLFMLGSTIFLSEKGMEFTKNTKRI